MVSEQLAHLGQVRPLAQELGPGRVAEAMGARVGHPDRGTGPLDDRAHRGGRDRAGSGDGEEHLAPAPVGASDLEVVGQCLAHVGRKRELVGGRALAAHGDHPSSPVDVLEAQSGDLGPTEPEAHEQGEDGPVPNARPAVGLAARRSAWDRRRDRAPGAGTALETRPATAPLGPTACAT